MERRLAAILAADVVGYSRLIGVDGEGTLRTLRAYRAVIDGLVASHHGRVFGSAGDSVVAEFASPVEAVRCAAEIQQAIDKRNADTPEDRRMVFRIGVNLGDVVVEGDDLLGDGVNVAARLQEAADPGGIDISDDVHRHIDGKIDARFADLGDQNFKNIAAPIRVWRWSDASNAGESHRSAEALALPDKPSVAVLPFTNMSGDPEQEYFADGITEDIITELSRFPTLFVIARNSSFAYKGQSVNVGKIGQELGVAYVVEGSVRKAGHRVRITTQLIEAESGNHLWAERYDRDLEDIFAVQDEVVGIVTSTLVGQVESDRLRRTKSLDSNQLAAYDNILRAKNHLWNFTSAGIRAGTELLEKATVADPSNADAHALLAMCHAWAFEGWWSEKPEASLELAFQVANSAVRLDANSGQAQSALAYAYLYKRQHDQAIHHFKRALVLLPCDFSIMLLYGMCLSFSGDHDAGLDVIAAGERGDPLRSDRTAPWLRGMAYHSMRRYQDAVTAFREMPDPAVEVHGWLAACHAQLDQPEEARAEIDKHEAQARREFPEFPGDTPDGWRRYWWCMAPYRNDDDVEHVLEGLRKAGLQV